MPKLAEAAHMNSQFFQRSQICIFRSQIQEKYLHAAPWYQRGWFSASAKAWSHPETLGSHMAEPVLWIRGCILHLCRFTEVYKWCLRGAKKQQTREIQIGPAFQFTCLKFYFQKVMMVQQLCLKNNQAPQTQVLTVIYRQWKTPASWGKESVKRSSRRKYLQSATYTKRNPYVLQLDPSSRFSPILGTAKNSKPRMKYGTYVLWSDRR